MNLFQVETKGTRYVLKKGDEADLKTTNDSASNQAITIYEGEDEIPPQPSTSQGKETKILQSILLIRTRCRKLEAL